MALNIKVPTIKKSQSFDLTDPAVRKYLSEQLGVAEAKPQANFLERVSSLLNAFETGNAVYEGMRTGDFGKGVEQYLKDVVQGITGTFSGDVNKNKKTYQDVLKKAGIKDKTLSSVLGFVGDIALDPSTYITIGTGAGAKVGGKTLSKEGAKVASNAAINAMDEIGSIAGKAYSKLNAKELTDAAMTFASKNKIVTKGAFGTLGVREVIEAFQKKALDRAGQTGAKMFQESAIRFGGKEIAKLGGGEEKLAKAIFEPTQMAMEYAAKAPIIKQGIDKTSQLFKGLKGTIGRAFNPRYDAEIAGLGKLAYNEKLFANFIKNTARDKGLYTEQIMKKLEAIDADPTMLPFIIEGIDPKSLPQLDKTIRNLSELTNDKLGKFLNTKVPKTMAGKVRSYLAYMSINDKVNANAIIETMKEAGTNKKLINTLEKFTNKVDGGFITVDGAMHKLNLDGLMEMSHGLNSGQLGGVDMNKLNHAASTLGINIRDTNWFPRKGLYKIKDGKVVKFDSKLIPITEGGRNTLDNILGENQVYLTMLQGITEGQIVYDIQEQMFDKATGKMKKWADLTDVQKKLTREKITQKIVERNARQEALIKLADFTEYIRDTATTDLGERIALSMKGMSKEAIDEMKEKGYIESSIKGLKGYMIPAEAEKIIKGTATIFSNDRATNEMLELYDKVMSMWKTSVTTWFPAFHIRNGISNVFINRMEGVKNPARYAQAGKIQRYANALAKKGVSEEELLRLGSERIGNTTVADILDIAEKNGVIDMGSFWDEVSGDLSTAAPGAVKRLNPLSKDFILTKAGGKAGNYIEGNARLALFIDKLEKGNGVADAAMAVKKALFDYSDLTSFEKNFMRRLIPFYSWMRFNAEYMTRFAVANPGKFGAILKGYRDIQKSYTEISSEDWDKLPAWARQSFGLVFDRPGAEVSAITGFGTPVEAFGDFLDGIFTPEKRTFLNTLGPIPRGIIESSTGISLFTGKEIKTDTNGKRYRNMPKFLKDAIGYREIERTNKNGDKYIEYIVDPNAKWVLGLYLGRITNEVDDLLNTLNDPSLIRIGDFMTGIKVHDFNLDEEAAKREKEAAQLLYDALIAKGEAKAYESSYLTKETKEKLKE